MNIDLACNDYSNGMATGYFDAARIITLEGCGIDLDGGNIRLKEEPGRIRVGKLVVPILGSREWVGNWCWNAYAVTPENCLRVVNYLRRRGWGCEVAPTEFFDAWERGEIDAAVWGRAIGQEGSVRT